MAVDQAIPAKGEREAFTHSFRDFKGVYTKSDRSAMIGEHANFFYHLENLIPIGAANVHSVPNLSAVLHDFVADSIYAAQFGQVTTIPYLFSYATNGKVFATNVNSNATSQISSALSGSGSRMSQWMNKYAIFADTNGIYTWDGTTYTKMVGANQPTGGSDVCVCFGRVFVASGRLISYSAANDGTATTDPINNSAWLVANGAGFINMTDPTLSGSITRLWGQNGYLYIFGATCVYAVADVYVPTGSSTPVYTLVPIQSIIGTDQPFSVFPYNRSLMFANRYGGWIIDGVNAARVSEDIDGTWQYLNFAQTISGGQCVVNNILCAAFNLGSGNDPQADNDPLIALWFNGVWWFANFGAVTFITSTIINAVPTLMAFIGNKLYSLFTDKTTSPPGEAVTALWDMGDPLSDKAVGRVGVEIILFNQSGTVSLTVDGLGISQPVNLSSIFLQFINNSNQKITFTGAGGFAINWTVTGTYELVNAATQGLWSKNVGMTLTTQGANMQLCGMFMDYKKADRWSNQ